MLGKVFLAAAIILLTAHAAAGQATRPRGGPGAQARSRPRQGPPVPKSEPARLVDAPEVDRARIKSLADEMGALFVAGEFDKFVDTTYPAVVELMGGKAAMVAKLEKDVTGWRAEGISVVSMKADEPERVVRVRDHLFAIVPATMRMKFPPGVMSQRIYHLGISTDDGRTWTFLSAGGADKEKLRILFPTLGPALDQLELPKSGPPTPESEQP